MQVCSNCGEQNPERFRLCGFCGTPLAQAPPPLEVRKTVTIVFSDLKGSTNLGEALDSETLRAVMTNYFDTMSAEITRHGGTIEKYIGDAIMAVFGLPTVHEDDALRAVRAAAGMQRALAQLNEQLEQHWGVRLTNRTGVNTGEVVAGDPTTGQRLVTGDAVNTAARLEQAAPANEILLGSLTYALVRDAVVAEAVEPLELKGKAERVAAYRLLDVHGAALEGQARREDAPIVGRERELAELRRRLDEAETSSGVRLITVIGEAGVGKSRLVREFLEEESTRAEIVRGRCLPYGEGITFWPLVEIIRAAAEIDDDDPPERARAKLLGLVSDREVAARVAAIAGLTPAQFQMPELYWGARRLLELLAARRPLIVVVDDIHWAEAAFLDFVEHVLEAGEAPILLVCTARHDLLETREEWSDGVAASRLMLEPLDEAAAVRVAENLLGQTDLAPELISRIVEAGEGNPLFIEQLLSMLIDSGALRFDDGRWVRADELADIAIPPTIHALLEARLDRLGREERSVIEPASVIGLEFAAAAVAALVPDGVRPDLRGHLDGLERKQFVRPIERAAAGDLSHRFQHLLIRDAAYAGLLKRSRATFHEKFVGWADEVNAQRGRATEYEEILGYHLEQAYRYLAELGPLDDHGRALGADAARRLSSAARRAFARGDGHAAANLYRRAVGLLAEYEPARLEMLPELGEALMELGEFGEAGTVLDGAVEAADVIFDDRLRANAVLMRRMVGFYAGEDGWVAQVDEEARRAIPVFERHADHGGLARAWRLLFGIHEGACRYGEAAEAAERIIEEARAAGDGRLESRGTVGYVIAATYGPLTAQAAIARCEPLLGAIAGDRRSEGLILTMLSQLVAMTGDVDRARDLYRRGRANLDELGVRLLAASNSIDSWRVEMLAGDLEAAERELRRDYVALEAMGERYALSTIAGLLGRIVYLRGDAEEALRLSHAAEELSGEDDIQSQALWRSVRALAHARRPNPTAVDTRAAEQLSVEAVAILGATQAPVHHADALVDRAEVLRLFDRPAEAAAVLRQAANLYAAKGDVISTERIRRRITEGLVA